MNILGIKTHWVSNSIVSFNILIYLYIFKKKDTCIGIFTQSFSCNRVIRKVSLCFDRFRVHYSHKPMETQSKALEFRGIIHKVMV